MECLRLCAHDASRACASRLAFGIWGLTFLAVAIFATPATLTDEPFRYQEALVAAPLRGHCSRGA